MNFVPILTRELRCRDAQRSFRRQRFGIGASASAVLITLILIDQFDGGLSATRALAIAPLFSIAPFMLFILGLHGAGALLSVERREGTLALLLLTRLAGSDIIIGKLLQSLLTGAAIFIAAVPLLVLPMLALGFGFTETCFLILACLNVLFFSLALGLLGAVFGETRKTASWCLFLFLPILADSTPFSFFLPAGPIHDFLLDLQWLNPCAAVIHAPPAAAGFRPGLFWAYLLVTHSVAWCFVIAAGLLLPSAVRRQAGRSPTAPRRRWWLRRPSFLNRERLLGPNPFLWLNSRDPWASAAVWLWLFVPALGWGWLIWLIWSARALNVAVVFVIAIGLSWGLVLLFSIPTHACRQLVADRNSGALELILCTPVSVEQIARGIWLSLRRQFLLPLSVVLLLSTLLMIGGYRTSGFGGMLDPEDLPRWLLHWSTGIFFLPLTLYSLCWLSIRRALFARNVGEAGAIAFLQVFGTLAFVLWTLYMLGHHSDSPRLTILLYLAAIITLLAFALIARRTFLQTLRLSASSSFSEPPEPNFLSRLRLLLRFPATLRGNNLPIRLNQ